MTERVVVGAAILHDGRVLAACRSAPAELAGGWEFPGGKVEDGESESDALVRECREEMGIEVAVGRLIGRQPLAAGWVLHVYLAEHLLGYPEPRQDHDEVRWLAPDDLRSVQWLPADRPMLEAVAAALRSGGSADGYRPG
ncbi:MAG: (deoxy)nucleoside triphosphate pyrophosphohydrolase [Pseudonocardiales bacterium]